MATGWVILIAIVALVLGMIIGLASSRFFYKKYFEENPPINEEQIANMLKSMGQPASQKRVNQIMKSMKSSSGKKSKK